MAARIGAAVMAVVAVGLVVALVTGLGDDDGSFGSSPLVGRVVPALSGPTLDGGRYDIDDHRGQWTVVNFFATWCVPCQEEHPELVAFSEDHAVTGDAGVVSIVFGDEPGAVADYFEANGGEWPVLIDDDGRAAVDFIVAQVPETFLVAPSGLVAAKLIGGVTREQLDRLISDIESEAAAGGQAEVAG